jgi:FkbM family methyltransferase
LIKEWIRMVLPRTQRLHRILGGPLRGLPLCTSWHDYPGALLGTTERPLLEWFARNVRAGQTWLDVGAHYGYTALALARLVGPSGRVFAFEPVPSSAACIERTREANGVRQLRVVVMGLSDSPSLQRLVLPLTRGMADSTLLTANYGSDEETILHTALDALWIHNLHNGRSGVDGIKIDVQGMELAALHGMRGLLSQQRPVVVVELHSGVDRNAVLLLLQECGYAVPPETLDGSEPPAAGGLRDDTSYVFRPSLP